MPLSNFFYSLFCCTRIGNFCLLFLNWEHQTLLPISSLSQDIFQTPNRMTLTTEKHFGTWPFSYITSFSSLSLEKQSLSTFPNRLLNTLGLSVVSLIVLGNKPTPSSTSRFLVLGDMFVFSWIVSSYLSKYSQAHNESITDILVQHWRVLGWWVLKYFVFQYVSFIFLLDYPAWRLKPELKRYYLMQIAYWCQQMLILVLGLEKPRKDY